MSEILEKGFKRDSEGRLCWEPGWASRFSYKEPSEALWNRHQKKHICNERRFGDYHSGPCGNPAKHDPDANGNPTKCGHHSKARKEAKAQKREKEEAERRERYLRNAKVMALNNQRTEIIQAIASGHNDPRGLCQDWLDQLAELKEGAGHGEG